MDNSPRTDMSRQLILFPCGHMGNLLIALPHLKAMLDAHPQALLVTNARYRELVEHGLEGVTLYMETYHRPTYAQVHPSGQKRDYDYRLGAIERAGRAGVKKT